MLKAHQVFLENLEPKERKVNQEEEAHLDQEVSIGGLHVSLHFIESFLYFCLSHFLSSDHVILTT